MVSRSHLGQPSVEKASCGFFESKPARVPSKAVASPAAVVLSADGVQRLAASEVSSPSEAESLGVRVANVLLAQGAAELIAFSRNG